MANNRDPLAALMVALRPVEAAANALPREMPDHCKLMVLDRYGGNPVEILAGDLRRINRLLQQCRMERPLQPYDDTLSEPPIDEDDTQPYFPIRR